MRSTVWMRRVRGVLRVAAVMLLAAGAWNAAYGAPLSVFVSILPQKQFAERIGGQHVQVSVMVGPGRSPATYEPSPRQMGALAGTRLYWRMGSPFEKAWMPRIEAANPAMHVVDARRGIHLRDMETAAAVLGAERSLEPHAHHGHGAKDPHIWLDPLLVRHMCRNFKDALVRLDPAHAADYQANFDRYARRLERLDRDIRRTLSGLASRRFMVFHPAWGYFAAAYDLDQVPIEIGGKSPGPRTLAAVIELARRERIRVIFVQPQFSRRDAETVARDIGGKVVAVDPLAADYMTNLRHVARVFAKAMQ
jgi:zinc transport system substrate-binding protein